MYRHNSVFLLTWHKVMLSYENFMWSKNSKKMVGILYQIYGLCLRYGCLSCYVVIYIHHVHSIALLIQSALASMQESPTHTTIVKH